jgi:hypothetical protein
MARPHIPLSIIDHLISTKFYLPCSAHSWKRRNNLTTFFCIDCPERDGHDLCFWCTRNHVPGQNHRTLQAIYMDFLYYVVVSIMCLLTIYVLSIYIQIRKASHHPAILVNELDEIFDVSGIQKYSINGNLVVFLNPRPLGPTPPANPMFPCFACRRALMGADRYCSLACKVSASRLPYVKPHTY